MIGWKLTLAVLPRETEEGRAALVTDRVRETEKEMYIHITPTHMRMDAQHIEQEHDDAIPSVSGESRRP